MSVMYKMAGNVFARNRHTERQGIRVARRSADVERARAAVAHGVASGRPARHRVVLRS